MIKNVIFLSNRPHDSIYNTDKSSGPCELLLALTVQILLVFSVRCAVYFLIISLG